MDAGSWLRELRARHRLSQKALADRAGTTQQAISRIEHGRVSPTVEMLARLAAVVGEELVLDSFRVSWRSMPATSRPRRPHRSRSGSSAR